MWFCCADSLESEAFKKYPSRLAFAVGKDIAGQTVVSDIAEDAASSDRGCDRIVTSLHQYADHECDL